jgi:hypothetical protein
MCGLPFAFISYRAGREKMKSGEWICDHSFSDCIMPPLYDRYEEKIQKSLSNTRNIKKEPAFVLTFRPLLPIRRPGKTHLGDRVSARYKSSAIRQ